MDRKDWELFDENKSTFAKFPIELAERDYPLYKEKGLVYSRYFGIKYIDELENTYGKFEEKEELFKTAISSIKKREREEAKKIQERLRKEEGIGIKIDLIANAVHKRLSSEQGK